MHSLYLNLALTPFSWLHNELFMCLSPSRADSGSQLRLLLPSLLPRAHKWLLQGCGRGCKGRVDSTDPHMPAVQAHKRTCILAGVWRSRRLATLPARASGPGLWEAGCELRGSYLCSPSQGALAGSTQLRK